MLYYYRSSDDEYTARSSPLLLDGEIEVSESEYNAYIESENKKHNDE